jgi:hypothetical protein
MRYFTVEEGVSEFAFHDCVNGRIAVPAAWLTWSHRGTKR